MSNLSQLIDRKLLKEERFSPKQITKVISKSNRMLKSAQIVLDDKDFECAYQLAYEAMLLAGRALLFSLNLRPRALGSHKIVIEAMKEILGKEKILVTKFDKMRKNRHYLIYGSGLSISETEALNSIESAGKFIIRVNKFIHRKNRQKNLFAS